MSSVEHDNTELDALSRRRWLQLMGASLALAGAGGCRWEKAEILPFAKRPPGRTPGKVEKFATAMELGGSALGLMVTCVDGRPIKIEGNPKHPASLGATNAFAQAAILELYDPDRSKHIIERTPQGEVVRTWDEFANFAKNHFGELRTNGGEGLAVLSEVSTSDTLTAMRWRLLSKFPKAKWYEHEPILHDSSHYRTLYELDKADVIVCVDADLFGTHPNAVRHTHDFAKRRAATDGKMNRLYVVESGHTISGAMADHRLALRSEQMADFVSALKFEVLRLITVADGPDPPETPDEAKQAKSRQVNRFIRFLAKDILAKPGRSVVVVGDRQPPSVMNDVTWLNHLSSGSKNDLDVVFVGREEGAPSLKIYSLEELVSDIKGGGLQTLLILGGNPVHDAPVNLGFDKAMEKVRTSLHLGSYRNETSLRCAWHLPRAHFLESWGDCRAYDGTYSITQPMTEPLYNGKSPIELLAMILQMESPSGRELVRRQFPRTDHTQDFESAWRNTLHEGFQPNSQYPPHPLYEVIEDLAATQPSNSLLPWNGRDLEIVFYPDSKLYDGRFANNGWLQELPDPMTKLTWDNAALMSPATAEKLGVTHEDVVKLKFKGREVEAPVYVMPGQADGTVAVSLGYGRTAAGKIGGSTADGIEPVGFDAYKLRTSDAMWFGTGLTVEPTGKKHRFATTHDRHWIDKVGFEARAERIGELAREATLEEYNKKVGWVERSDAPPSDTRHFGGASLRSTHPTVQGTESDSLWQEPEYKGRRWGMTIDLSKCVGCGACVVACQAENNIPIVGRDRVLEGREMHWLRIDRYFQGDPAADGTRSVPATGGPKVVFQPVPCQQCEMAPCEQVCPVGATVHSAEGLNDMVYNRCIGVRYCGNNCPYKVRRFNFFNYHKNLEDPANEVAKMAYNPEVTVRSRGVMEKCTYCVQRIQAAKIEAKNRREATIPDGQIKTACQQACPAQAIIFGDLNDPQSEVARQHQSDRAYQMLAELNTKPRTSYLMRIRNPNPELEDV